MKPAPPVTSAFTRRAYRRSQFGVTPQTGARLKPDPGSATSSDTRLVLDGRGPRGGEPQRETGRSLYRYPRDDAERGPLAGEREERADDRDARAGGPGPRCVHHRPPCEHDPAGADGEEKDEPDRPRVRQHLDVEVLDAPFAPRRRERLVDHVGELLARVGEVLLEHLGPGRALPPDAQDRVVLPDP